MRDVNYTKDVLEAFANAPTKIYYRSLTDGMIYKDVLNKKGISFSYGNDNKGGYFLVCR